MSKKSVRLELWVIYDSEDGYVWPQVYPQKPDLDLKMNGPLRTMCLTSAPYSYDTEARRTSGSFGTEIELDKPTRAK